MSPKSVLQIAADIKDFIDGLETAEERRRRKIGHMNMNTNINMTESG